MTGLALAREEKYRFTIFMLEPLETLIIVHRRVMFELSCGMRIQLQPGFIGFCFNLLFLSPAADQIRHDVKMLFNKKIFGWERQDEHWVIGYIIPINEFINHVVVYFKWKN